MLDARCSDPQCDGVVCLSQSVKEALWDKFYTGQRPHDCSDCGARGRHRGLAQADAARARRLPEVEGDKPVKKKFANYAIGYFHLDIAEVHTEHAVHRCIKRLKIWS